METPRPITTDRWQHLGGIALVGAVLGGLFLRLWPRSALWLDEAQSVAFARLPLTDIPHALRQDGAPPLYYLLLHIWMRVFGDSDAAVRSLSIVFSIALIAVLAVAARRIAGTRAAVAVVVLVATNPFAIRYATETRMYALVALEAAIGVLLVHAVLQGAGRLAAAGIAITTAALLYSHYWSLYLIGATVAALAATWWVRRGTQTAKSATRALLMIAFGGALWLPWFPTFRFQAGATSTPWTRQATVSDAATVLLSQSGGPGIASRSLAVVLSGCIVGALALRTPWSNIRAGITRAVSQVHGLAIVGIACPLFAAIGGAFSGSAFVGRYTSVVFPVLMLLAAIGVAAIDNARAGIAVLLVASTLGIVSTIHEAAHPRTPASTFAQVLEQNAHEGDVLIFCPDQLGPALSRELHTTPLRSLTQGVFPDFASPERVNWIDYTERYTNAEPFAFAREAIAFAGDSTVWLVWSGTYPPTQTACNGLVTALGMARPDHEQLVADNPRYSDHGALWRFDPPPPATR